MTPLTVINCLTQLFAIFGTCAFIHSDRWSSFQSYELKSWLLSHGVATSQTTSYNPRGNGQCEKYNDIIWRAILGALKSRKLPVMHWELVMTDALHSIRSLLCSSINCTPHERMFRHTRRSVSGMSLPSWLKPGPIYVKRHVRNKGDPFVDEAQLLELNPTYARVRLNNGRETSVSIRDLAPCCEKQGVETDVPGSETPVENDPEVNVDSVLEGPADESCEGAARSDAVDEGNVIFPRRSTRARKPVNRYGAVPYM